MIPLHPQHFFLSNDVRLSLYKAGQDRCSVKHVDLVVQYKKQHTCAFQLDLHKKDICYYTCYDTRYDTRYENYMTMGMDTTINIIPSFIHAYMSFLYRHKMMFFKRYRDICQKTFWIKYFDNKVDECEQDFVTFYKSRPKGTSRLLLRLNEERHFPDWQFIVDQDIPFLDKKSVCLWRGSDTGGTRFQRGRGLFVKTWFKKHEKVDVGLTYILDDNNKNEYNAFSVPNMSLQEQLRYKYIVSLEGNDVSTSLKWILISNSICFMPPVDMESWLLETKLVPYYHFIPIAKDFSDVLEKIDWCEAHPNECLDIIRHATEYMQMFYHDENEIFLTAQMLRFVRQTVLF